MKKLISIFLLILTVNCSTTELVDYWKNPEINSYEPKKILIIGVTSNKEARLLFEEQLVLRLKERDVDAHTSLEFGMFAINGGKWSERDFIALIDELKLNGFDTVIINKIIGVEDEIRYKRDFDDFDSTYRKFQDDFLMYQDIYYNPDYYEEYTIYHAETSMYCLCTNLERELLWKGQIDIYSPESVEETVSDYVNLITAALQEERMIPSKEVKEVELDNIQ